MTCQLVTLQNGAVQTPEIGQAEFVSFGGSRLPLTLTGTASLPANGDVRMRCSAPSTPSTDIAAYAKNAAITAIRVETLG